MNVAPDDAIVVLAKAARVRFGAKAVSKTQERIEQSASDIKSLRVWRLVRSLIVEMEREPPET